MSNKLNKDAYQDISTTIYVGEEEVGTASVRVSTPVLCAYLSIDNASPGVIDGIIAEYVTEYIHENMHCTTSLDDITALREKMLSDPCKDSSKEK